MDGHFDIFLKPPQPFTGLFLDSEPLFVFRDHSPVKAFHMRTVLKNVLLRFNLNWQLYSTHSFRIGRTNELFKRGVDIETIKKIGRWKSNAVYK